MHDLRHTDTNSANDSRGKAFGMEGNDFVWVLGAFVVALGLGLLLTLVLQVGIIAAVLLTSPFLLVPSAWILVLRRGKPEGYAEDLIDQCVHREGWSAAPFSIPKSDHERRSS